MLASESADRERRTVSMKWYTGSPVLRVPFFAEPYNLTLSLDPKHVRMGRLQSGKAPLLDSHNSFQLKGVIGVVEKAELSGDAVVRFSARDEVTPIWQDVQDGILRNASVGLNIFRLKEITKEDEPMKHYLAVDWEPMEVSLLPIGADPNAGLAAASGEKEEFSYAELENDIIPAAIEQPKEEVMEQQKIVDQPPSGPTPEQLEQQKLAAERTRVIELGKLGAEHKLKAEFVEKHIQKGTPVEEFRQMLENFEAMAARSETYVAQPAAVVTRDEVDTRREALSAALLHRFNAVKYPIQKDLGSEYRGYSLFEIARLTAEQNGKRTGGMSKLEVVKLAMSTSDFPFILENVANKSLRAGYEEQPRTFTPFCRQVSVTDFKQNKALQLGAAPTLVKVNEGGEFPHAALSEARETYQVLTYGQIIPLTRQAIINDDLGAFTRLPAMQGAAAARLESNVVWAIITANGAMADGKNLFSSAHANDASGADVDPPDIAELGAARKAMRIQTGLEGETLNIVPRYILGPAALETTIAQLLTSIVPAQFSNVVPDWVRSLTPIIEPRLDVDSTTAWYLAADPNQIDTIWYCYLDGQQGVFMESRVGFDVDGIELKVRHDFGAAAIDHRGLYRNEGT